MTARGYSTSFSLGPKEEMNGTGGGLMIEGCWELFAFAGTVQCPIHVCPCVLLMPPLDFYYY